MTGDARVDVDPIFDAFGVPAVVRLPETPEAEAIATTVVWIEPITELSPAGLDFPRAQSKPTMVLRRDEVPRVPVGTIVRAAERDGQDTRDWRVDGIERIESDQVRVKVIRNEVSE